MTPRRHCADDSEPEPKEKTRPGRCSYGRQGRLVRRMSGMQMDEGDARLLEPVTERIIGVLLIPDDS
jgi:hypothetical protein